MRQRKTIQCTLFKRKATELGKDRFRIRISQLGYADRMGKNQSRILTIFP